MAYHKTMYRQPDKLLEAMERVTPMNIEATVSAANATGGLIIFVPLLFAEGKYTNRLKMFFLVAFPYQGWVVGGESATRNPIKNQGFTIITQGYMMRISMERHWDIFEYAQGPPFPSRIVSPYDQSEMVLIPSGEFTLGIDEEELMQIFALDGKRNPVFMTEVPPREVFVGDYYIDVYPVTNDQYAKFIEETGHRKPFLWGKQGWNDPLQPVVGLGWDDARDYASWAGKKLPREEQWEKAARGADRRWWPWGNDFYVGHVNSGELQIGGTTNVKQFPKGVSPYGCYDMSGNVWEMCEGSWIHDMPLMRGGCFLGGATFVRATVRWSPEDPLNGAHWLGFRCIKEIPQRELRS